MQDESVANQLRDMQAQINALQQANMDLRNKEEAKRDGIDLRPEVRELFAPHLQLKQMDTADRKRAITGYPKSHQLPQALTDANGLAAKAVGEGPAKKWALTTLPALQREALDVLRVAAVGLHAAISIQDGNTRINQLERTLMDVIALASDNAQRMARTQLETIFDAAGAKGAMALISLDRDQEQAVEIDLGDSNILQAVHVDAMQEIKKYARAVQPERKQNLNRNGGGRGGGGGRGRRGNYGGKGGGKGYNSWRNNGGKGGNGYNNNYNRNNYNNGGGGKGGSGGNGGSPNGNGGN